MRGEFLTSGIQPQVTDSLRPPVPIHYVPRRSENEYVLGTHDAEIERLGLQHCAWRPRVQAAWLAAGIGPRQTVMDVGCGPGYASLDLAELVGGSGHIVAIDKSERFLSALDRMRRERGITNITAYRADLEANEFPDVLADSAWCRWVFAFVKNPRNVLARVAAALKPGGVIVLHEYFNYATWQTIPPCAEIGEYVSAVMASWRDNGGDPDIGLWLPGRLEELGFELRAVAPIVDAVHCDQARWAWLRAFICVGRRRLVELGLMSDERAEAIWRTFTQLETRPGTWMITPGVLEIIAVKR